MLLIAGCKKVKVLIAYTIHVVLSITDSNLFILTFSYRNYIVNHSTSPFITFQCLNNYPGTL